MNKAIPLRRCCGREARLGPGKMLGILLASLLVVTAATVGISQDPFPEQAFGPSTENGVSSPEGGSSVPAGRAGAAGDIIGFSHSDDSGTQTITLVHTEKSWMAVYHIDRSGKIRLVSSRPIEADFTLQLNATSPLPEEIRQLGGQGG